MSPTPALPPLTPDQQRVIQRALRWPAAMRTPVEDSLLALITERDGHRRAHVPGLASSDSEDADDVEGGDGNPISVDSDSDDNLAEGDSGRPATPVGPATPVQAPAAAPLSAPGFAGTLPPPPSPPGSSSSSGPAPLVSAGPAATPGLPPPDLPHFPLLSPGAGPCPPVFPLLGAGPCPPGSSVSGVAFPPPSTPASPHGGVAATQGAGGPFGARPPVAGLSCGPMASLAAPPSAARQAAGMALAPTAPPAALAPVAGPPMTVAEFKELKLENQVLAARLRACEVLLAQRAEQERRPQPIVSAPPAMQRQPSLKEVLARGIPSGRLGHPLMQLTAANSAPFFMREEFDPRLAPAQPVPAGSEFPDLSDINFPVGSIGSELLGVEVPEANLNVAGLANLTDLLSVPRLSYIPSAGPDVPVDDGDIVRRLPGKLRGKLGKWRAHLDFLLLQLRCVENIFVTVRGARPFTAELEDIRRLIVPLRRHLVLDVLFFANKMREAIKPYLRLAALQGWVERTERRRADALRQLGPLGVLNLPDPQRLLWASRDVAAMHVQIVEQRNTLRLEGAPRVVAGSDSSDGDAHPGASGAGKKKRCHGPHNRGGRGASTARPATGHPASQAPGAQNGGQRDAPQQQGGRKRSRSLHKGLGRGQTAPAARQPNPGQGQKPIPPAQRPAPR